MYVVKTFLSLPIRTNRDIAFTKLHVLHFWMWFWVIVLSIEEQTETFIWSEQGNVAVFSWLKKRENKAVIFCESNKDVLKSISELFHKETYHG